MLSLIDWIQEFNPQSVGSAEYKRSHSGNESQCSVELGTGQGGGTPCAETSKTASAS
jgi:hypothetical protein